MLAIEDLMSSTNETVSDTQADVCSLKNTALEMQKDGYSTKTRTENIQKGIWNFWCHYKCSCDFKAFDEKKFFDGCHLQILQQIIIVLAAIDKELPVHGS